MNVVSYLYRLVDGVTSQFRSSTSLIESGGWYFKQIATYTESNPLLVTQGQTVKLVIPQNDVGFVRSKYFDLSYDFPNQRFMPVTPDDVYLANIRLKVKPTNNAGHMDVKLNIPNFEYNPINGSSEPFTKSANEEHFISVSFQVFIGEEAMQDGIEAMVTAVGTDLQIYDYSFLITRLYSNKGNS